MARLKRLEQILAHARNGASLSGDFEAAAVHLDSVPLDRIRKLTDELSRETPELDTIEAVTIRLLLNEYTAAVGHLRAVARMAAARVDGATKPMKDARRALHRLTKQGDAAVVRRPPESALPAPRPAGDDSRGENASVPTAR